MAIWVVLTDDWELRGNGTGTVEELQRIPALRLMSLYEKLNIRSTFNLEVMQQLAFERLANTDGRIRQGRDDWRQTVRDMIDRGFDVQLHIHPQWHNAERTDGWWKLDRRWHIADYEPALISNMFDCAMTYLKPLIAPREIESFRAGAWGLGPPSAKVMDEFAKRGIKLDVSIVDGIYYNGEGIRLDYRGLERPHTPYRPDIDDVRKVARSPDRAASIIELPTQSVTRRALAAKLISSMAGEGRRESLRELAGIVSSWMSEWPPTFHLKKSIKRFVRRKATDMTSSVTNTPYFVMQDPFGFASGRARTEVIVDLSSSYSLTMFKHIVDICIERARNNTGPELKILVFENHTKDLRTDSDFIRIEGVIRHIQQLHPDVSFHTLSQVVENLDRILKEEIHIGDPPLRRGD